MARRKVVCFRVDDSLVRQEDVFTRVKPPKVSGGGISLAVTSRAFNGDYDLAADFLVSPGQITGGDQAAPVRYCAGSTGERLNIHSVLDDLLAIGVPRRNPRLEFNSYVTNSRCVCRQPSVDMVRT